MSKFITAIEFISIIITCLATIELGSIASY